jgi:carboxynorspermidine decarboxylase
MAQPPALYEARLGREKFGKEVHAYSVAYSTEEGEAVAQFADKVMFKLHLATEQAS